MAQHLFQLHEIQTRYIPRADLGYLPPEVLASISTPQGAAEVAMRYLNGQEVEHLIAILLSVAMQALCVTVISKGTADTTICMPRDVFREAVRHNATGVILAHNHPSGGAPLPSRQDIETTAKCKAAGELLGITLLDHIIVSGGHYPYSFREHGQL